MIYIQPGTVPRERQLQFCLEFCQARSFQVVAIVPPHRPGDAVGMVAAGRAAVIVSAFSSRHRPGDVRDLAAEHGVHVKYVRPPVVRREVGELVVQVFRNSGNDVEKTAKMLGYDTGGIRAVLARMGVRVPRQGNGMAPDSRE